MRFYRLGQIPSLESPKQIRCNRLRRRRNCQRRRDNKKTDLNALSLNIYILLRRFLQGFLSNR